MTIKISLAISLLLANPDYYL